MATNFSLPNGTASNESESSLCFSGYVPEPSVLPLWAKIVSGIILFLITLATIFGNILVIVACLKFQQLRSKITNYFIISLAFADVLVGVLVMPPAALQDLTGTWYFGHFCPMWVSLDVASSTASILNLCNIIIDRYIAITRPFHYHSIMTNKTAIMMIIVGWILSISVSFGPIYGELYYVEGERHVWETAVDPAGAYCKPVFSGTYAVVSSVISFWIPTVLMIFIYGNVLRIARNQAKKIAVQDAAMAHIQAMQAQQNGTKPPNKKQENKALKAMLVLMGVFLFCWTPFFIINCSWGWPATFEDMLCRPWFVDFYLLCVWLGWINSVFNPFIYSLNPQFKRAYEKLLCCGKVFTKDESVYSS